MNKYFYLFILIISFPTAAYAYLDPATGSIILQAIIAFFASVIAYMTIFFRKTKKFFKKIFNFLIRK